MEEKRHITFNDIKDFERKHYSLSLDKLEEIFNLVIQDGEIEFTEDNIKALKYWVKFGTTIFISDYYTVEGNYIRLYTNNTELKLKLIFWTTIIKCGYRKSFPEEELHYSKKNLNRLCYFVADRTRPPKKVIDGESAIMSALSSGDGDAFGF